jgi:hypothetical protein
LAILTFAGKDATAEFNMIHPPDVIGKYAPDAVIGKLGDGGAAPTGDAGAAPAPGGGAATPLLSKTEVGLSDEVIAYTREIANTLASANPLKLSGDRAGLTRSAFFLIMFIVIHAVGNLHVFLGPDDFNGYGYFYVRLYWTGFGFPANIVEEYVLLCAVLHVCVGLRRTLDKGLGVRKLIDGSLNLAVTGVLLLTFMTIHLFQFRFGATEPYLVRPPKYLINFEGITSPNLFWSWDTTVTPVPVRDIYKLEFDLFQSLPWCVFYWVCVVIFMTHACLGWSKVTTAPLMGIPAGHHSKVKALGYMIFFLIGTIYLSFPLYTHLCTMKVGNLGQS